MMVGSLTAPLIIAFSDSITRAISPPEATCVTGWSGVLLLALKRKLTLSAPSWLRGFSVRLMLNRTFGMPSGIRRCFISSSTFLAALRRMPVKALASFWAFSRRRLTSCSCSSTSSSLLSMWASCSCRWSLVFISSSTFWTWNFCWSEFSVSRRSLMVSRRAGSNSTWSTSVFTSWAMSLSSM